MGLDTSHNCWHGSYIAFTHLRHALAEAAGYAVWKVEYNNGDKGDCVMLDWGHITPSNIQGIWAETPNDPLIVLIAHSDCDGKIYPAQAGALADRLDELAPLITDTKNPWNWPERARQFAAGLRDAAAKGEPVDFH